MQHHALSLRTSHAALAFAALAFASLGSACGGCAQPNKAHGAGAGAGEGESGEGEGSAGEGEGEGEGEGASVHYTALVITPANPVLEATVGGSEVLSLQAFLVDDDGNQTLATSAFWGSLNTAVGDVDQAGVFTPSRERAGDCLVRARAQGIEGTTTITVHLHEVVTAGGVSNPGAFTGAATAGLGLLYPEDGVVIPGNLAPMDIQWDKSHALAHVQMTGAYGSLDLYTDGNEAQASADAWRRFLLAHIGGSFTMMVEESDGAGADIARTTITINLAAADLTSTVYYWAVDRGRIVRIDADSLDPIDLAIPSADPADTGCRACHSLSANGQKMSFTYNGGNGMGGVIDADGTPIVEDNDGNRRWNFSALSPEGSLMVTTFNLRMTLRDGASGSAVPGYEDLGVQASQPSFSPTGTQLAFANNIMNSGAQPAWEIDFTTSDLAVADVDPVNRTIAGARTLVQGHGNTIYFPSFSPDGRLVAYAQGTSSRSTTPADLMLTTAADQSGDAPSVMLARANPNHSGYAPTFNPKVEGGYMWIAFYSRRDYGFHTRGLSRPQVWVAAVDANADPSTAVDPSHPGFWLPGQSEDSENLSSFFAPKPCSQTGGLCDVDAACCGDGLCRPVGGVAQCVPPALACSLTGDACSDDSTCCDG
ncbi:MAG TPA: hypothetical protein VGO62_17980, partial [Myxococcota bacterium]